MRQPRFKVHNEAAFYHCYNRVSGTRRDRPFGRAEKEAFVRLLHRLSGFFTIDVVAYQVMSNHFHLLLYAPECPPPAEDVCRRYAAFYPSRPPLDPQGEECARIGQRMANFSEFVGDLQQQFSVWFNQTRSERRRGSLWGDRFRNTLLDGGRALWGCWAYIEMNPVRAGIVANPGDYRFSSYGAWSGTGRHPFSKRPGVNRAFESLAGLCETCFRVPSTWITPSKRGESTRRSSGPGWPRESRCHSTRSCAGAADTGPTDSSSARPSLSMTPS